MKKILLFILVLLIPVIAYTEILIVNPTTGKLDFVGISGVNSTTATVGNILVADGGAWNSSNIIQAKDDTLYIPSLDCTGNTNAGALTADANGKIACSDDDGGAGGSGDVLTVNSTAVDTTGNLLDGDIDFTHVDGGAGGPDDITATVGCTDCIQVAEIDFINSDTATSGHILIANGDGFNSNSMSGDVFIDYLGATTIQADSVALTTDTTGNYVATLADAGNSTISVVNGSAEGGAATVDAIDLNCTDCINATEIEDIYLLNGSSDIMTGTLTADGLTLGQDENITLGAQTLDHNGTDFVFNDTVSATNIANNSATATAGNIYVADGNGFYELPIGSDNQVLTVALEKGLRVEWAAAAGGGSSQLSDLADVNSATNTAGNLLVADGAGFISSTTLPAGFTSTGRVLIGGTTSVGGPNSYNFSTSGVAEWKLNDDEATTTVVDSVGSFTGTASGNTNTLSITGKIDKGMNFVASSTESIDIGSSTVVGTADWSVLAWTRTSSSAFQAIYAEADTGQTTHYYDIIWTDTGKLQCNARNGAALASMTSSSSYNDGNWHSVIMKKDAINDWTCYIDGDAEILTDATSVSNITVSAVRIGALERTTVGTYMDGDIDNVVVVNEAITDATALAWHNAESDSMNTSNLQINAVGTTAALTTVSIMADNLGSLLVEKDFEVKGTAYLPTIKLEGSTEDAFETTIAAVEPTADNTFTLPNMDWAVNSTTVTKGTILFADGNAWHALPVGSNDQLLTADSTQAAGIKWAGGGSGATQLTGLADVNSATNTTGNLLIADGAGFNSNAMSGDVFIDYLGATTIQSNSVALTTDTTGNYVTSITNGTGITGGDGGSEGAALTLSYSGSLDDNSDVNTATQTKGALMVSDGIQFHLIGVGSNDQLLTADNTEALGVKWAGGGSGATQLTGLADVNSSTLTVGNLLVASGDGFISSVTVPSNIHFSGQPQFGSGQINITTASGTVDGATLDATSITPAAVDQTHSNWAWDYADTDFLNSATATAGNIYIGDGDSWHELPIGSNNQVLTIDTALPTKVNWEAAAGGGGGRTNYTLPIYSAKLTGSYVTHTPSGCGTTASAASATIEGGSGPWKILIDATTDEAVVWQFVMPDNYSSAPTLDVHFAMASGTANEVEFEAAIMCYTPTTDTADVDTESFADCAVGTATTVSASAGEVYSQSITLTDDSCASGDDVWIWLSTDADDATNDDATGDREVINVEFGYTGS